MVGGVLFKSRCEPEIQYLGQSSAPDQGHTLASSQNGGYYMVPHPRACRPAGSAILRAPAHGNASSEKEVFQVSCNICSWKSKASNRAAAYPDMVLEHQYHMREEHGKGAPRTTCT